MQYLKLRPLLRWVERQRSIRGAGTSWHSRSDSRASSFPSRQSISSTRIITMLHLSLI